VAISYLRAMIRSFLMLLVIAALPTINALAFTKARKEYGGGAGVGRFVVDEWIASPEATQCHYDMVLVERIQIRNTAAEYRPISSASLEDQAAGGTGLYVPEKDLPKLHLCRVLSVGPGREEENGMVVPPPSNLKVGNLVIAKNPWGIGPKDEETPSGKKLSFMRSQDIAAVISNGTGLID
jgi:co-chaperonin GroES (HSP10)